MNPPENTRDLTSHFKSAKGDKSLTYILDALDSIMFQWGEAARPRYWEWICRLCLATNHLTRDWKNKTTRRHF
jgi:hypothetical protein